MKNLRYQESEFYSVRKSTFEVPPVRTEIDLKKLPGVPKLCVLQVKKSAYVLFSFSSALYFVIYIKILIVLKMKLQPW